MIDKKTVLVSGASGLVGRSLCQALEAHGYEVRTLSRGSSADFQWNIADGKLDATAVKGAHAVIHLAGESVAQRWTDVAKKRILSSRVDGTKLLTNAILESGGQPVFLTASGISFYGTESDMLVDESSPTGEGFLAEVTRQWEAAANPLEDAGCRVVYMRTGIVMSADGGALKKMLTPFKLCVGGRIGNGKQLMSWISLPDLVNTFIFALENDSLSGVVNAVAPKPVTNLIFTKTLGFVIGRPTIFPLPKVVVTTLFGEMGKETVLSDLGVLPKQLMDHGYTWQHPQLEDALRRAIYADD